MSRSDRKVVRRTLLEHPTPTPLSTPCRLFQGSPTGNGYGRRWVSERQTHIGLHVWVWESINGPTPTGTVVRHRCDQTLCYRYDHLEVGTQADNSRDMMERGRGRGQFKPGRLTPELREEIARRRAEGETHRSIAAAVNLNCGTICRVLKGEL